MKILTPKNIVLKDSEGEDLKIQIQLIPGMPAHILSMRILKLLKPILPSLGKLLTGARDKKFDLSSVDIEAILEKIAEHADLDKVTELLSDIASYAVVGNQSLEDKSLFDAVFAGNQTLLYRIVKEVLAYNFADFFTKKVTL